MTASENSYGDTLTAQEIIDQLDAQYQAFTVSAGEREKAKTGLAGLFDKWFRSTSPSEPEPLYADFLKSVQALVNELAEVLRKANAEEIDPFALAVSKIMLAPKPIDDKTQAEWFMVAAEYSFSALIPLLTPSTLQMIRDDYVRNTPKRMMYPRQRDLLKSMELNIH